MSTSSFVPKILLTGGAGYIGAHVSKALKLQHIDHVIVDNCSTGIDSNIAEAVPFYQIDISDTKVVEQILVQEEVNIVIHLAASISVEQSVVDPASYYTNNFTNTLLLMSVLKKCPLVEQVFFASTAAVYGNNTSDLLVETEGCQPSNPYGRSKLMAEQAIVDLCNSANLKYTILRFFNVAGIAPTLQFTVGNSNSVIRKMCRVVTDQQNNLIIYGNNYPTFDGTPVRDFIHVQDLAAIFLFLMDRAEAQNQIINCGYGQGNSVLQIANSLCHINKNLSVEYQQPRAGDIYQAVADNSKLLSMGWCPRYNDLLMMIEQTLAWEHDNKSK
jgi:UDP-glucose 4-epimerase